jgi:hypothetical protein
LSCYPALRQQVPCCCSATAPNSIARPAAVDVPGRGIVMMLDAKSSCQGLKYPSAYAKIRTHHPLAQQGPVHEVSRDLLFKAPYIGFMVQSVPTRLCVRFRSDRGGRRLQKTRELTWWCHGRPADLRSARPTPGVSEARNRIPWREVNGWSLSWMPTTGTIPSIWRVLCKRSRPGPRP